jgi:hypothetical protein
MNPVRLVVLDASLRPIGGVRRPSTDEGAFISAAFSPHSHAVILLARIGSAERARVELLRLGRAARPLETLTGGLYGLAPSPDGKTVLVGWSAADRWLLVQTHAGGGTRRITGLAAAFGSSAVPVANAWAR